MTEINLRFQHSDPVNWPTFYAFYRLLVRAAWWQELEAAICAAKL